MSKTVKRICLSLALFVMLVFVVFVFNQTVQVVHSARELSPVFGKVVEWTLVLIYSILLLTPVVLWLRLPKRMQPPLVTEGREYERFMLTVQKAPFAQSEAPKRLLRITCPCWGRTSGFG